jgi:hypothetical protein
MFGGRESMNQRPKLAGVSLSTWRLSQPLRQPGGGWFAGVIGVAALVALALLFSVAILALAGFVIAFVLVALVANTLKRALGRCPTCGRRFSLRETATLRPWYSDCAKCSLPTATSRTDASHDVEPHQWQTIDVTHAPSH